MHRLKKGKSEKAYCGQGKRPSRLPHPTPFFLSSAISREEKMRGKEDRGEEGDEPPRSTFAMLTEESPGRPGNFDSPGFPASQFLLGKSETPLGA